MIRVVVVNCGTLLSGAEIILREYLKSLSSSQVQVSLIIANYKPVLEFFKKAGSHIQIFTVKFYVEKHSFFLSRLVNIFMILLETLSTAVILGYLYTTDRVDVIYCNNTLACVVVGLINKLRLGRYKTVFHIHDMMSASSFKLLFRLVAASCEQIITASNACKEDLVECTGLNKEKVQVIYNGVEIPNNLSDEQKPFEYANSISIGFAGSINPRKGLIYLAEAYKVLRNKYDYIQLTIAYNFADFEYEMAVNAILGNLKGVKKLSFSSEQMPSFYKALDILVVPSLNDPLPTVVLEALSYGKIVIGSDIDGIPEMLEQEYLFAPASSEAIVNKLEHIINNFHHSKSQCQKLNPLIVSTRFSRELKNRLINNLLATVAEKE